MTEKKAFLEALNSMSPQARGALIGGLVGAGGAALLGDRKKILQNMLLFGGLGAAGGYGLSGYLQNRVLGSYGRGFQAARTLGGLNQVSQDPNARQAVASTASAPVSAFGAATGNPALMAAGHIASLAGNRNMPGFARNAYNNAKYNYAKDYFGKMFSPITQGLNSASKIPQQIQANPSPTSAQAQTP